jgi:hypothetical protein
MQDRLPGSSADVVGASATELVLIRHQETSTPSAVRPMTFGAFSFARVMHYGLATRRRIFMTIDAEVSRFGLQQSLHARLVSAVTIGAAFGGGVPMWQA